MFAPNQYDIEQDRRIRFMSAADNERLASIARAQYHESEVRPNAFLARVGEQMVSIGQRLQNANKDSRPLESGVRPAYPIR